MDRCPSEEELAAFVHGTDDYRSDVIRVHVAACPRCRAVKFGKVTFLSTKILSEAIGHEFVICTL
jgi:anti-sigma factor ChrR (cupin superfamily)